MPSFTPPTGRRSAYTLVELLIVVVILGILSAILIPSLSSAGVLRIQGALRMVISDITTAQADAIAFQQRRAVIFNYKRGSDPNDPGLYTVAPINDSGIDYNGINQRDTRQINTDNFGGARLVTDSLTLGSPAVTIPAISLPVDGNNQYMIIFDELGTPMTAPTAATSAPTTEFTIGTNTTYQADRLDQFYRIRIEALTGRVTLQNWTPREN